MQQLRCTTISTIIDVAVGVNDAEGVSLDAVLSSLPLHELTLTTPGFTSPCRRRHVVLRISYLGW